MTGVVHIITALERGGAQRIVLEIASALHDPGRPQLVVTGPRVEHERASSGSLDDEAERRLGNRLLRVRDLVGPIEPLRDVACVVELTRLIDGLVDKLGSPIVVHTHSSKAGVVGRTAARAVRGVAIVHTVHGFGIDALGPRRRWLLEAAERASGAADVVVYVSEADRERAQDEGLFASARASRVIRAGVDAKALAALERVGGAGALTIANLKPQKDPLLHVEILAAWRAIDRKRARLTFLGDGPLRSAVEARARALGVDDALALPGFVDDVRPYLAQADVCLLASAWEGLPMSVVEATAAGLPCVIKDTGYAHDLAWARTVTALPPSASPAEFASALSSALDKRDQRAPASAPAKSAKRAAPKIPRAFTQQGMLDELRELYDELIGMPRPTGRERRPLRRRRRG